MAAVVSSAVSALLSQVINATSGATICVIAAPAQLRPSGADTLQWSREASQPSPRSLAHRRPLCSPLGVAVTPFGHLFVVDRTLTVVHVLQAPATASDGADTSPTHGIAERASASLSRHSHGDCGRGDGGYDDSGYGLGDGEDDNARGGRRSSSRDGSRSVSRSESMSMSRSRDVSNWHDHSATVPVDDGDGSDTDGRDYRGEAEDDGTDTDEGDGRDDRGSDGGSRRYAGSDSERGDRRRGAADTDARAVAAAPLRVVSEERRSAGVQLPSRGPALGRDHYRDSTDCARDHASPRRRATATEPFHRLESGFAAVRSTSA